MERKAFTIKKASAGNWDEVFKKPRPITLESFVTAQCTLSKKGVLNLKHPNAAGIKDKSFNAPVLAHWIRHREFGDYLIDAGMDSSYRKRAYGRYRGLLVRMFMGKCRQEEGQDIASRIEKHRIHLKGVFFTHLHFDHISGAIDLAKDPSIQYVAGKGETYFMVNKRFLFRSPDFLGAVDTLHEIDFTGAGSVDMPIVEKCVDIFGDGSLWAISTGGHTKGHVSFLVNGDQGPALVTGDACLVKESLDTGIGPGTYSSDLHGAQKSLERLLEFTRKYPAVQVFCGHQLPPA